MSDYDITAAVVLGVIFFVIFWLRFIDVS